MRRLPIRVRLTLAFAGVMALVLGATGLFLYVQLRSDLDRTLDQGLLSRAEDVSALVHESDAGLHEAAGPRANRSGVDFSQILDARGTVFDATPGLGRRSLLSAAQLRTARRRRLRVARAQGPALAGPARLLATPLRAQDRHLVVVVGASLERRDRALADLRTLLLAGGPGALLLASLAGYGLGAAALRPVEFMRRRAASISTEQLDQRLPLGHSRDELHSLGETLNAMLGRLEAGLERERAFTADASHELRTPLTLLKTELELIARDRPQGNELDAAVHAAIEEADRLAAMVDDLLVLARSDSDQLPLDSRPIEVRELLTAVKQRAERSAGREIGVSAAENVFVRGDAIRLQQAVGNLVDNALRHGGGRVQVTAHANNGVVELHVTDEGSGLVPAFLPRAFERFARGDPGRSVQGAGLGLAIVDAIARTHRGRAHIANRTTGGTDAWIEIPAATGRR